MRYVMGGLACVLLAFGAGADEEDTSSNMQPKATTSTQHPGDETPQHSQPQTPGEQRIQQEVQRSDPERPAVAAAPSSEASGRARQASAPEKSENADASERKAEQEELKAPRADSASEQRPREGAKSQSEISPESTDRED